MCLSAQSHLKICKKIIRYIKTDAPNSVRIHFTSLLLSHFEAFCSPPCVIQLTITYLLLNAFNVTTLTMAFFRAFSPSQSVSRSQLLPCFTRFILKFNSEEVGSLPEIIENLRSCLRWPQPLATTKNAIQKNQKEVFGCVNRSLIRSRQLFDVWLKRIQSIMDEHKPIDLIILLMMMTINDEKSTYIENIVSGFGICSIYSSGGQFSTYFWHFFRER